MRETLRSTSNQNHTREKETQIIYQRAQESDTDGGMSTSSILWSTIVVLHRSISIPSGRVPSKGRCQARNFAWACGSKSYKVRAPVSAYSFSRAPVSSLSRCFSSYSLASQEMSTESVPPQDASSNNDVKTVNVRIKGKVQGVFYRNWTVDTAKQLGLKGWVRNCRDGSVEAVFSGDATVVDSMIQKCYRGPELAKVSGLDVFPWDGTLSEEFERRPTEW